MDLRGCRRSWNCVLVRSATETAQRERDAGELRIGGRALELYTGRTLDLCG